MVQVALVQINLAAKMLEAVHGQTDLLVRLVEVERLQVIVLLDAISLSKFRSLVPDLIQLVLLSQTRQHA